MDDKSSPTLLEDLPIEIFLQIFAPFLLSEIVTAFSGLNSYIDSCIQTVTNATHILNYNNDSAMNLLRTFPRQINRLIITHSPTVDFTSLINLRSLTLKYGTLAQFNGIRPQHFPQLEILHLCGINGNSMGDKTKSLDDLFEVILSNGFPRLRICTAVGFESLTPNCAWTECPSLRLLILDLGTPFDYEQIRSLCPNLRQYKRSLDWPFNPGAANYKGPKRYFFKQIIKVKEWEAEKKFIVESWPTFDTAADQDSANRILPSIRGRIFPKKDPYCFASFMVEIKFPTEYPFRPPEAIILDRIYHTNIRQGGRHCCCWGFGVETWSPAIQLTDFINGIITVIDNVDIDNHCDKTIVTEYEHNYDQFYEKALRCTLDYGRPRF